MKRIGVSGGMFDPFRLDYAVTCREIIEGIQLDRLYLVVSISPQLKDLREVSRFIHRWNMARIGTRRISKVEIVHPPEKKEISFGDYLRTLLYLEPEAQLF